MVCVLVVEDETTLLKNVARSLRNAGYDVLTAESCEVARTALRDNEVHGICLDIGLPDGDGLDLLEEVRLSAPDLPAIVMSSATSQENRLRAAQLGVSEFLPKPFRLADIKAALVRFIVSE